MLRTYLAAHSEAASYVSKITNLIFIGECRAEVAGWACLPVLYCTAMLSATSVHVAAGGEAKVKVHPSAVSLFKDHSLVINSDLMSLVPQLIT